MAERRVKQKENKTEYEEKYCYKEEIEFSFFLILYCQNWRVSKNMTKFLVFFKRKESRNKKNYKKITHVICLDFVLLRRQQFYHYYGNVTICWKKKFKRNFMYFDVMCLL